MGKLVKRLTEPSTYASIAGVLVLAGVNVDQQWIQAATQLGAAVAGVLGIFMAEKGGK